VQRGEWWQSGVLYQIYPRSWADSNADGVGDLAGITNHLDHLRRLGVDGIWLNPIHPSPSKDWGYDVSDYLDVHPNLGTLADLDRLVAEASREDIRVLLDLVPNHTSDLHPWFIDSRSSRQARHRDWYVWADPRPGGLPPNNWVSSFGGPAWTLDPITGQYYLHNFLPEQPDLNWWSDEVRDEFDQILRFWFDRKIAGFRIDVTHGIIHDRELRDNPPALPTDHPVIRRRGQRPIYNVNRPEVHDILRRWRALSEGYPQRPILLGETYVLELTRLPPYYGSGDELHMAFNFPFLLANFDAEELRTIVETAESLLPPGSWPVWTASNHDISRFPTRWCGGHEDRVRTALLLLMTLRGTPVLYYGDEIGMTDVEVPPEMQKDPLTGRGGPKNRDPERTPMQWSQEPGAGFSVPGVQPWLPLGDFKRLNVEDQRRDPDSTLNFCRRLIELRKSRRDLVAGVYRSLPAPPGVWAFRRGSGTVVAINLSGSKARVPLGGGKAGLLIQTASDALVSPGDLILGPWQGAIVEQSERQ
jgi:alpha-glucosidase